MLFTVQCPCVGLFRASWQSLLAYSLSATGEPEVASVLQMNVPRPATASVRVNEEKVTIRAEMQRLVTPR
jgi:hypothetical protein